MVSQKGFRAQALYPYLITIGLVALTTVAKSSLSEFLNIEGPLTLYYTAVLGSAWFGGRRQGFFAILLSILSAYLFFIYPKVLFTVPDTYGARMALFIFDATIVTFVCTAMRNAQTKAEHSLNDALSARSTSLESQLRFRRVFESNMVGLMLTKSDGTILECNDYVLNLLGYTREEFNSGALNWRSLTPPEFAHVGLHAFEKFTQGQPAIPFEKEYFRKDGSRVPILLGASKAGNDVAVTFIVDISTSKKAEQALEERVNERTQELREIAERLKQSQQFLDSVIENMPNMIFVKDAKNLCFVRLNKAGEKMLGHTREELLGKNDFDFFSATDAEQFQAKDREVIEGRKVIDIAEEPLSTKNGLRYVHTKKIPIFDNDGKPIYLLGISEDITERKEAERQRLNLLQEQTARAEVEKTAEQLRFLSEASAALNESLDLKGRLDAFAKIVIGNIADWFEIVLMEESELKVQEYVIAHSDSMKVARAKQFRSTMSVDWEQAVGVSNVIKSGKPMILQASDMPMVEKAQRDPSRLEFIKSIGVRSMIMVPLQSNGRTIGSLSIAWAETNKAYSEFDLALVVDLARRAAFAIENSRLYRKAQEASQAKSVFLANMSHEIRTPLGAILGFAELMDSDNLRPEQKEYLATLLRNGRQLLDIVDEVLDLSKVESEQIQIERVEFSIPNTIRDVEALLRLQAEKKNLDFKINGLENLPHKIISDPLRMRQILTNVIGNAIKFTLRGAVDVKIELHTRTAHPGKPVLEVIVSDTGIGISKEQRERLFQPFVQADNSTTRRFGGTGLGLFLSRRLARLMDGDVILSTSTVNKGSQFIFTAVVEVDSIQHQLPPRSSERLTSEKQSSSTVLIVDDAPDNRTLIQLYLARLGFASDTATSGKDAVKMAISGRYDLILMDVQMPGMDGFEAVQKLRSYNYLGPIVALTAHTMKGDRERCLEGGFDDYLGKPLDRELLKQCLKKFTQNTPSAGAPSPSLTQ